MLYQQVLVALFATASVTAVPLNINLGAYSPALVVGDGEISFAGTDGAGNLIEELESGAVSAGQQNGEAAPSGAPAPSSGANIISPSEQAQASVASVISVASAAATTTAAAATTTTTETASSSTSTSADAAATNDTPARAINAGVNRSIPPPNLARRESVRRSPANRASSSFQLTQSQRATFKRDLAGFREALNYAIEAQKNTPKIEVGTENAGVGILVNPGLNVPQGSAAAGTPETKAGAKRSLDGFETPEEKAGITLLAIAEI